MQLPAEQVYDAWLKPTMVRLWMPEALKTMGLAGDVRQVEIDPRIDGKFLFSDQRAEVEASHWGTYLELERPTRIVFTCVVDESEEANPSLVSIQIEPASQGCIATITHRMDATWADYILRVEQAWSNLLHAIDTSCR